MPSHPILLQGTELRDALLGRIFGYAAVIRSGRTLPDDLANSMAAGLVQAAQKKSFLREVAGEGRSAAVVALQHGM
jgi:hypothetical protein